MSNTANAAVTPEVLDRGLQPLRIKWGWIVALGVVFLIAGLIALSSIVVATAVSVTIVGVMMLVSGIAEIISAFSVRSWGKFFLWVLLGALYVIAGLLTFQNPILAAGILTLMLGVALVVSGFLRIFLAMQMKEGTPWGWVALSGIITVLVGGMILAQWPVSSLLYSVSSSGLTLSSRGLVGSAWVSP